MAVIPGSDAEPARHPTGEPPLRMVVIGCGRVFERFHRPALLRSADWTLAGAVDIRPERLRWLARLQPGVAMGDSLAALGDIGPFDAVLVATPAESHCALGAEALRLGAHLFIEKPMALRPGEAASLLALAREGERQVWVGFNRRFRPGYAALRRRLRDVSPERYRRIDFELHTDPRKWAAVSRQPADPEQGGGLLDDLASHQLDLLPWLLERPVQAVSARYDRRDAGGTVVSIGLRLAQGVEAHCRAGHGDATLEWVELDAGDGVLVAMPGGLVRAPLGAVGAAHRWLAGRNTLDAVRRRLTGRPAVTLETFQLQLAEWAEAVRGRRSHGSAADGRDGARCVVLTDACRHSLAGGGAWVPVASEGGPG